jgi:hypothetical protein
MLNRISLRSKQPKSVPPEAGRMSRLTLLDYNWFFMLVCLILLCIVLTC